MSLDEAWESINAMRPRIEAVDVATIRLIAAAPLLLSAIEDVIDSMGPDNVPPSNAAIENLRAAYTKATGRKIPS